MKQKINVAIIFGGQSGEHEVSLSSARAVINNLDTDKYQIIPIVITKKGNWLMGKKGAQYLKDNADKIGKEGAISEKESQKLVMENKKKHNFLHYAEGEVPENKIDVVFPLIHGPYGEDGRLQGMLDMLGMKYVFSGVLAHALGMNKAKAKIIAKNSGVGVAQDLIINKKNYSLKGILSKRHLPLVVKPLKLGSSVGISIAKNEAELKQGIKKAFQYGSEVILEDYIAGREFTVTIMGNENSQVLAITEIIPLISEFYDYKAKYEEGGSKHICPAEISSELENKLKQEALKTYKVIGCRDLARADFMYDEKKKATYFIDINTVPGMTTTSLAPEAAKEAGMQFGVFLDRLIVDALKRK